MVGTNALAFVTTLVAEFFTPLTLLRHTFLMSLLSMKATALLAFLTFLFAAVGSIGLIVSEKQWLTQHLGCIWSLAGKRIWSSAAAK